MKNSVYARGAYFLFLCTLLPLCLALILAQSQIQVGYSVIVAEPGSSLPVATALFSFSDASGTLLWQAGVSAVEPIRSGRIFVDYQFNTRTAIALVNSSTLPVNATLVLRDSAGLEVSRTLLAFGPRQHVAKFIHELFSGLPAGFTSGTLTFETASGEQKLAAVTLRENVNAQQDTIFATLPVVDLGQAGSAESLVLPQIAAGGDFATQLVLVSRSNQRVTGRIRLFRSDGSPLQLSGGSELSYDIPPGGTFRAELASPSAVQIGYAVVTLEQGDAIPSASAIFQIRRGDSVVSETGVAAIPPTTSARIFVDRAKTETAIAIASPGNPAMAVTFDLFDRNGVHLGATTQTLPAAGHLAKLASELFPGLPEGFTGLIEITSPLPIVPITLKLTTNARGDRLLTSLPVADLSRPNLATSLVFPQIAFGSGFSTRLIFISTDKAKASAGRLNFFQSAGNALAVPLGGQTLSQLDYSVAAAGARQFRPGTTATAQQITLDPFAPESQEIAVNEGSSLQLSPTALDSDGNARDDFSFTYVSTNPEVASVDALGKIDGKKAGFSTLVATSGALVKTVTITVARITAGASGFEITGVAQDLARRLYLTASNNHTVLLAEDLSKAPQRYAGISQSAGLHNDERLRSLFQRPAFLALDHSQGTLYVSDSGNGVIRRVLPGLTGRVETLALSESLNSPQGLALDNRGNLWVADSGSHTIRRVNLLNNEVQTVAGKGGSSGSSDGAGDQARFNSPIGIAIETESLAQQLERERTGAAPPPVTIIVADSGNGRLRRVHENGQVETIAAAAAATAQSSSAAAVRKRVSVSMVTGGPQPVTRAVALTLNSPTGVAVDAFGNIYVSETASGQVKTVLKSGAVVPTAQIGTFDQPRGIAFTESGRIVVAEGDRSVRQVEFGPPAISSVNPARISSRGASSVTIRGKNFAPGTLVVVAGTVISGLQIVDTETLTFTAPALPSGRTTVTVQNRGGLAQAQLLVDPVPLSDLAPGEITTVAGGTTFSGDGSAATSASLAGAEQVALDNLGNLYIADSGNHKIRRVDGATGIITTVAGRGTLGFAGDGGPATAAALTSPGGVAVNGAGDLFISDTGNSRIRKVDAETGIISTVAGRGLGLFSGDNGPAASAVLNAPRGLAFDQTGNLFIVDSSNHRIRRVDSLTGIIVTVAGNGQQAFSGDGGPAVAAALKGPYGVAVDAAGNLFIADSANNRIRKVNSQTHIITTVDGHGVPGFSIFSVLKEPRGVAVDPFGNLFIADTGNHRIRKLHAGKNLVTTVAGQEAAGFSGEGAPARFAALSMPHGIASDGSGNLFVADRGNSRIRKIAASDSIITTVAGSGVGTFAGDNDLAVFANLNSPQGIALDREGNLLISDSANQRVRKVAALTGIITTVAGNGAQSYSGDDGPATSAALNFPGGLVVDAAGNLYIADTSNHRVRRVDPSGVITTVAGMGLLGFTADNVAAGASSLTFPFSVALDAAGNLLIADTGNNRIRKVDSAGIITTIAGTGQSGFSGDNGPATQATLSSPASVTADTAGNLFIADSNNDRVRKIDAGGVITTLAGDGRRAFGDDGGPAMGASLNFPLGVTAGAAGNVFVLDTFNYRVRRIAADIIATVAGTGASGFGGDNGPAVNAAVYVPIAAALDAAGNLYIVDNGNNRIRVVKAP
ncbi:MAG: IPT/TIG domain-containing protein [Acidobacteriota bacterium]